MHEHKKHMYHSLDVLLILSRLIIEQNTGKATVFFDLQGHCQLLTVRIYAPVWESGAEPSYKDEVYLDTRDYEKLKSFRIRLSTYLNTL